MKRWEIRYDTNNIWVSREFPEIQQTLSRVIARVEGWEKDLQWAKRSILQEAKALGWKGGKAEMLEKKASKVLDEMEKECGEQCLYCSNFFYPCGYKRLVQLASELGMEEKWNSNQGNPYYSFAPTYVFVKEGVELVVSYSGWEVK